MEADSKYQLVDSNKHLPVDRSIIIEEKLRVAFNGVSAGQKETTNESFYETAQPVAAITAEPTTFLIKSVQHLFSQPKLIDFITGYDIDPDDDGGGNDKEMISTIVQNLSIDFQSSFSLLQQRLLQSIERQPTVNGQPLHQSIAKLSQLLGLDGINNAGALGNQSMHLLDLVSRTAVEHERLKNELTAALKGTTNDKVDRLTRRQRESQLLISDMEAALTNSQQALQENNSALQALREENKQLKRKMALISGTAASDKFNLVANNNEANLNHNQQTQTQMKMQTPSKQTQSASVANELIADGRNDLVLQHQLLARELYSEKNANLFLKNQLNECRSRLVAASKQCEEATEDLSRLKPIIIDRSRTSLKSTETIRDLENLVDSYRLQLEALRAEGRMKDVQLRQLRETIRQMSIDAEFIGDIYKMNSCLRQSNPVIQNK